MSAAGSRRSLVESVFVQMARVNEGDERWIVEHRTDGRNVGGWHWEEKDASRWLTKRFEDALAECTVGTEGQAGMFAKIGKVTTNSGEAMINMRKNKFIVCYEWTLKASWTGECYDAEGSKVGDSCGSVEFAGISEENDPDEVEFRMSATNASREKSEHSRLSDFVKKELKPKCLKALEVVLTELKEGGPFKAEMEARQSGVAGAPAASVPGFANGVPAASEAAPAAKQQTPAAAASTAAATPAAKSTASSGVEQITVRSQFKCAPADLYECFVNEGRISAYTQAAARMQPTPGAVFEMYNGLISGEVVSCVPNKELKLKWRMRSWTAGCVSSVKLSFEDLGSDGTRLIVDQTNIPKAEKAAAQRGWEQYFVQKIKMVFGYGGLTF